VKLLTSAVRPLPAGDLDSRRAVSGDLRELAAATTEMLTGKREPGAGVQLASPFKEFVRASFGTEEFPSPTAAQLLSVLRGQPLAAANRVSAEQTSAPAPEPVEPAPAVPIEKTVRFRPGVTTAVLASMLVLVIAFAAYRLISRDANTDEKLRTRVTDEPPRESALPSPAVPPRAAAPQAVPPRVSSAKPTWGVIAAAYNDYDAAARRAARLGSRWKHGSLSVFPAKGQGSRYFVLVGLAASPAEAESLLARARAAGMPSDTYVTRLRF
jgi:hypothetical protein